MKSLLIIIILLTFSTFTIYAQDEEDFDIFLIDAYITPEIPHTLIITFITSDSAQSQVVLNNKITFVVSRNYQTDHKLKQELTDVNFDSANVPFKIIAIDAEGNRHISTGFELVVPGDLEILNKKKSSALAELCLGSLLFLLPSPSVAFLNGKNYFEITKEIPLLAFYSGGFNYPSEYLSIEYSHVFNAPIKNFLRLGYKRIFLPPLVEYFAPGINVYTDFLGHNGFSPELNFGLFKIYNVFTIFTKYRYNFQLFDSKNNFHEISIGLYSSFFSINL